MRLIVHVPEDRKVLLSELERRAGDTGRSKDQIVLDALEAYLVDGPSQEDRRPYLGKLDLGAPPRLTRDEIYGERIEHRARPT
jgi:hypothetical protein